ncbi:MAG TPA: hypothetical protein VEU77_05005 [Candidatus Acidoferrales bacterium]|nr:hypothetical protein [Candidatus Acidoferrales bacterium]
MTAVRGPTPLHVAIFLVSLLTLMFEFAQTRLFSAALDYHLTFLVLSGALLGVGAGATASSLFDAGPRRPRSAILCVSAAALTVAALLVETHIDPIAQGTLLAVSAGYVASVAPVLCVSWLIVRTLREAPRAAGGFYAADLAGAAAGSLLGYVTIGTLGAQGVFGAASASALVAAAILTRRRVGQIGLLAAAAFVLSILSVFGEDIARPLPGPLKQPDPGKIHDAASWDPLARIDVSRPVNANDPSQYAFLIAQSFAGPRPPSLAMTLDLGALTPIIAGGASQDLSVFDSSILAAPDALASRRSELIVGPGGGVDVLVALAEGVTDVSAVEVNRTEIALMRGRYAGYSGRLYFDPRVRVFEDEARSFVRRSSERYDLITVTVVDSFAALSAGAYALTESYLYTREAMEDYLRHLRPQGVVSVTRWYRDPPLEIGRLVTVARDALADLGVADPARSIAVIRYGNLANVIVRAEPFTAADVSRLKDFARARGFDVVFDPLAPSGPLVALPPIAAPTDDRPFFFDTVPLSDVLSGQSPLPYGYAVLLVTLVISSALAGGAVLLPSYAGARRAARPLAAGSAAALLIGLGFIASEIVLLQRLTLYLGQPSLALSIGVAALLLGAATGSALSLRLRGGVAVSSVASAVALLATLTLLALVVDTTLEAPLVARVAVAGAAAYLIGLPLGTVLPRLIRDAAAADASVISWLWATNGAASVVGVVLATAVALAASFTALGAVACVCYALTALVFLKRRPL